MPTRRSSINQQVQIGAESIGSPGSAVPANKSLRCFNWAFGPNATVMDIGATGRKFSQATIENDEWVDITCDGLLDYNGIVYPLDSIMGTTTPTTHGSSSTAKDWVYTPPVTGPVVQRTYTLQQGDASTRAHQAAYAFFTDFGYKGDRTTGLAFSGKGISQPLSDGITLTSTPTAIALAPVAGKYINVYLDSSSGNLGQTQLNSVLNIDFSYGGISGPFYPFNRANLGFTSPVDLKPKTIMKLLMEADATGMAELPILQNATTQFLRIDAQGLIIDNTQFVTITGGPTGGTFTLTYKGQTTSALAYNASSSTVQTALLALSNINAGDVTVTGSSGGPYSVILTAGQYAQDATAITANGGSLTGGSSPGVTITNSQPRSHFTHDMAVKISKPNPFSDKNGVFAIEWEFTIIEDATWGKAQTITVTNLLTGL